MGGKADFLELYSLTNSETIVAAGLRAKRWRGKAGIKTKGLGNSELLLAKYCPR